MGNGNNDVGKTLTRSTGLPIGQMGATAGKRIDPQMQAAQPPNRGAMSHQGSFVFHGNEAAPQKLVRLVGCHDQPEVTEPWIRPRPARR